MTHRLNDVAALLLAEGRSLAFGTASTRAIREQVDVLEPNDVNAVATVRQSMLHVETRDLLTGGPLDTLAIDDTVSYDDELEGWTDFKVRDKRRSDGDGLLTELIVVVA